MQGLQVFDKDGNLSIDVTDRLTKFIGECDVSDDMTIYDEQLKEGELWYAMLPLIEFNDESYSDCQSPSIQHSASKGALEIKYPKNHDHVKMHLIYGVF